MAAWYETDVYPPVLVAPGEAFWISADTNDICPPDASGGSAGPVASRWRRPPFGGGSWSVTGIVAAPVFKIRCHTASAEVPYMSNSGLPQINTSMTLDISQAPPTSPAAFFILAFDDTMWSGFQLPLELTALNAPGCFNYTSADQASIVLLTNGAGSHTLNIPNNTNLLGLNFYNQYAVIAPSANLLGITTSNAGAGVIGN